MTISPEVERVARALWFAKYRDSGRTWESVVNTEFWFTQAAAAIAAMSSPVSGELLEAQSAVQAWVHVVDGLEAHIMDREAIGDPASPSTYLAILRGDVADIKRSTEQICNARWADYRRMQTRIDQLEAALANRADIGVTEALKAEILRLVDALQYAHREGFEWPVDPMPLECLAWRLMIERGNEREAERSWPQ